MQSRKDFIKTATLAYTAALLPEFLKAEPYAAKKLTILHTNDVHSQLEPFPMDGGPNQGLGGIAARAKLIEEIRANEKNVLLLDAGDMFQGTPYFNIYKGEPEIKAMTKMGYDAGTIGNHDFDGGLESFASQLQYASFSIVCCNYNFNATPFEGKSSPYKIFRKERLKIGITGVGIALKGLVPEDLYGKTEYSDPITKLNETAYTLKKKEDCDIVICLSHLGYNYGEGSRICDVILAKESEDVDLIIGGHTHTFMKKPETYTNKKGNPVVINQVGWGGIRLGRLDFEFSRSKKPDLATTQYSSIHIGAVQ